MTTVFDVPPDVLIQNVASKLKENKSITIPDWALYVKTGPHCEKPPEQPDWWFTRAAAVFRKVYMKGPIGVERLSAKFGGARDRGSKPYHAVKGSRSIIRTCIQQLEEAGYVEKLKNQGRVVTPKGRSMLDNSAHEVLKNIISDYPDLNKY